MTFTDFDIDIVIERQESIRAEVSHNQAVARIYGGPRPILGRITEGVDSIFVRLGELATERQANRARLQKDV